MTDINDIFIEILDKFKGLSARVAKFETWEPSSQALPSDNYVFNEASDYTTSSSSFVDVDATDLSLTITTSGGDVLIGFHGSFEAASAAHVYLDVYVDTADDGGDDGYLFRELAAGYTETISFVRLITGLSAGSHTFKLRWKTNGVSTTLYAGAGTATKDVHPQFWVKEFS